MNAWTIAPSLSHTHTPLVSLPIHSSARTLNNFSKYVIQQTKRLRMKWDPGCASSAKETLGKIWYSTRERISIKHVLNHFDSCSNTYRKTHFSSTAENWLSFFLIPCTWCWCSSSIFHFFPFTIDVIAFSVRDNYEVNASDYCIQWVDFRKMSKLPCSMLSFNWCSNRFFNSRKQRSYSNCSVIECMLNLHEIFRFDKCNRFEIWATSFCILWWLLSFEYKEISKCFVPLFACISDLHWCCHKIPGTLYCEYWKFQLIPLEMINTHLSSHWYANIKLMWSKSTKKKRRSCLVIEITRYVLTL